MDDKQIIEEVLKEVYEDETYVGLSIDYFGENFVQFENGYSGDTCDVKKAIKLTLQKQKAEIVKIIKDWWKPLPVRNSDIEKLLATINNQSQQKAKDGGVSLQNHMEPRSKTGEDYKRTMPVDVENHSADKPKSKKGWGKPYGY